MLMRQSRGRGFSVMEMIVALALIAVLTAVLLPAIFGKVRDARTAALSQTFFGLNEAIGEYKKGVTKYPPYMRYLTTKPTALVDKDACGTVLTALQVASWRGPYTSRTVLSSGIAMGGVTILDSLGRTVTTAPFANLIINATGVDTATANALERELDGDVASATTGTIRWGVVSAGAVDTLKYVIPISGC